MENVLIIGGGISGLSVAHCLKDRYNVKVLEKESRAGGLIKCDYVNGNLYHLVGGHVFNSRRKDVLDWFWQFFDKDKEFVKASRNAIISMADGRLVGYPIENHMYMLDEQMMKSFIDDLMLIKSRKIDPQNFEEFLRGRFGETLYQNYFQSYNEKIWRKDLRNVSLSWLEGKLPMPTVEDMIYNNFNRQEERSMVHSSFYYAKKNGSQFLADRLAENLNISYNSEVKNLNRKNGKWQVNDEEWDKIIFCGNIKNFPAMIGDSFDITAFLKAIEELESHGTTSVLCEISDNPYSWIYMPSKEHLSHRIICTGNFSEANNAKGKTSGVIEFTDYISKEDIDRNLSRIPFSPKYLAHTYTQYTYPVQNVMTREMLNSLKKTTESNGIYLLGRFAEWEYYNMDAAVGAALDLSEKLKNNN